MEYRLFESDIDIYAIVETLCSRNLDGYMETMKKSLRHFPLAMPFCQQKNMKCCAKPRLMDVTLSLAN